VTKLERLREIEMWIAWIACSIAETQATRST
jgi:hypothetical protein